MMRSEEHLLLILHAPPEADQAKRVGRLSLRKPDGLWTRNHLGSGLGSLLKHLDDYDDRVDYVEE